MTDKLKPIRIKINGRHASVPAYHIGQGAYPHVRAMLAALGLDYAVTHGVDAQGHFVNIITDPSAPAPLPLLGRRIAISAGHYGKRNQSPCNSTYFESEFVLRAALELEEMLISDGAIVHLPRRDASPLTLTERSSRIDRFGADITIDLHTDAAGTGCNTQARGVHAIHQISRPNDKLASLLVDEVAKSLDLPARARKIWTREGQPGFDWYHMLRVPHGHNVIIEAGFHTSRDDIAMLGQADAARKYAQGARSGLIRFASHAA